MVENNQMDWYAVRVQNNKEKFVLEKLQNELRWQKMESILGNTIIPTEKSIVKRGTKKILREKVIIPGYIFIQTNSVGELANIFKSINGASGFVRTRSGEVSPMKAEEVNKLMEDQEKSSSISLDKMFLVGDTVKIIEGAFSSFVGKVISSDKNTGKLKIEVSIFGRSTPVELTTEQVIKES